MKEWKKDDLLKALTNSGYLFESEIANKLSRLGYFVEANTSTLDPITGKSREIDIFCEYREFDERCDRNNVVAATRFVFEIKNNDFPLILMTNHDHSPNVSTWESLKIAETVPEELDFNKYNGYFEKMINSNLLSDIYTQYCTFELKKNGELMATHSESLYSGLNKIVNHCEDLVYAWNGEEREYVDDFLRNFLYFPVLLLKDHLYELTIINNSPSINKVESSLLLFSYHYKGKPSIALIQVLTERYLEQFLLQQKEIDAGVIDSMIDHRKGFA